MASALFMGKAAFVLLIGIPAGVVAAMWMAQLTRDVVECVREQEWIEAIIGLGIALGALAFTLLAAWGAVWVLSR